MVPDPPQRVLNDSEDSSPKESDANQGRFKFSRKKRESKTNNMLVIETAQPGIQMTGSPSHKLTFILKKSDDNELQTMNDMLERQKELEIQRFVYNKFKGILGSSEESEWRGEEGDFKEEAEFESRYGAREEAKKGSCFLEVAEMSEVERMFVDLESMDKKSLRYMLKAPMLRIRR